MEVNSESPTALMVVVAIIIEGAVNQGNLCGGIFKGEITRRTPLLQALEQILREGSLSPDAKDGVQTTRMDVEKLKDGDWNLVYGDSIEGKKRTLANKMIDGLFGEKTYDEIGRQDFESLI
ncbi:hypothetical protein AJ80_00526 [Polytolypa hystricis UAMH7299]|uniref:Uncharacterized protein n=1 Tax=Polytolypa hystricis (strain UAMH7299) TaxID=1447883 RepID=A0A2B7Z3B7_POLH7|nr:hypothetical protein AJ80_00526 [Polytolypa hystricis UAMH7299]